MAEKRCPDCGETKPLGEFRRNGAMKDGLAYYCRSCAARRERESYQRRRVAAGHAVRPLRQVPDGYKYCPACQVVRAVEDFHKAKRQAGGLASWCKRCKLAQGEERRLQKAYGLDRTAIEELTRLQGGRCAVCRAGPAQHVDHDHVTGRVRGLVCFQCNVGLGNFKDDAARLRAAADYVERFSWQRVLEAPGVFRMVPPREVPVDA